MKKIKVVLIAVAILIGANVSAQNSPATFGVRAGVNLSNIYGDDDGLDPKIGFNVGVTMDYALSPTLYLMTGLELTTKGASGSEGGISITFNLMYLQLPVHIGYKIETATGTRFVLHAGPYVAYGIGGNMSVPIPGGGTISVGSFSNELGMFDRFDFGVGVGVGAQLANRMTVGLGFDLGLANILRDNHEELRGLKGHNMSAHLTVGFRF